MNIKTQDVPFMVSVIYHEIAREIYVSSAISLAWSGTIQRGHPV